MALSADTNLIFEIGPINTLPCAASAVIYKGAALGDSSGYARPLTAGDKFLGFADAKVDNSVNGGAAGAKNVDVITEGFMQVAISGVAITDRGKPVYMSDDATFTLTETSNSLVGFVHRYVSSGYAVIKFGQKTYLGAVECATTAATSTSPFGFTTAEQANSIVTAVNKMIVFLNGI